ncbi:class I SAM-dependent methyltransferase [Corynebacterium sp. L4756]|uniref:class I SAM-dependent methyltransferase n=1 Tax=unclassified Corynebacterium TaxID=2624378 RepID=UPI00374D8D8B
MATDQHLSSIDHDAWPGIASTPSGLLTGVKARRAEAEFAKACANAGLSLEDEPDLTVHHDALFARIAHSGWLGIAESFMAGEWSTPDSSALVKVLTRLLEVGYNPATKHVPISEAFGGELPGDLVALYSGDGLSHHGGAFTSGVPTTVRESWPTYSRGVNKNSKPHFVDVTTVAEPDDTVDREDLADAQRRWAEQLCDMTKTNVGTHMLVYPASGAQVAVSAAARRATVDIASPDDAHLAYLHEQLVLEGVEDSVACVSLDDGIPRRGELHSRYEAIVSIEKLEALSPKQREAFAQTISRALVGTGRVVLQSTVATETMSKAAHSALQPLRAYIWPGMEYPTTHDVHKLLERNSGLRVIEHTHVGTHYKASLRHERSFFDGRLREAAAAGFDQVFRRLWTYQFALREALLSLGMIDSVAFTAIHRHRGGRR